MINNLHTVFKGFIVVVRATTQTYQSEYCRHHRCVMFFVHEPHSTTPAEHWNCLESTIYYA